MATTSRGGVSGGALVGPGAYLTYSAPSAKLTEQADGFLKFQAHNLFLWSEDFSQATWTKANCTATAGEITVASAGSLQKYVQQAGLTTAAFDWRGSFELKQVSGIRYVQLLKLGSVNNYVNFDLQAGTVGSAGSACVGSMELLPDGYYRCTVEVTNATTHGDSWRVQIVNSTSAAYNDSSTATGSVLIRKAHFRRQNSQPDYIATTTAPAYDLPYVYSVGLRQHATFEPTAATNLFINNRAPVTQNITTTAQNYVVSFRGTGSLTLSGTATATLNGTGANDRVSTVVTATAGTLTCTVAGTVDLVNVCAGSALSSEIITHGAAVARAADTPQSLLSLFPSIGTAYTVYAKYKPQSASVATTAIRLDDTTANELVSLGNNASGQGLATVTDGGAAQAAIASGTITSAAFHRVAASVEANNVRLVVNGGTEVQDASVTLPTLTRLLIGAGGGMDLVQLAILPGARTEAQLQALGA